MVDPAAKSKSNHNPTDTNLPRPVKRGRWLRRLFFLMVLFGALGWFAPLIVAKTSLKDRIPGLLISQKAGRVRLGDASLGWLSPIVIKDIRVESEDGSPLLEIAEFSTSQLLWSLATQPTSLGTFRLVEPVFHVSLDEKGSNLEQFLENYLAQSGNDQTTPASEPNSKQASLPKFLLEIDNARIELENRQSKHQTKISPIALRLSSKSGAVDEIDLAIGNPPEPGGDASATDWLVSHYGSQPFDGAVVKAPAAGSKHAVIRASHWKLECLEPLLNRLAANTELTGEFSADTSIQLTSTDAGMNWDWNGSLSIDQLLAAGLDAMRSDRLSLDRIELTGRAAMSDGRLAMHDFKLSTDVGELTATGDIRQEGFAAKPTMDLVTSLLSDEDYHINGRVDLKRLASLLPQTLRIREGIEITSGDAKVEFVGVAVDGVRRWSGIAALSGLRATNRGQEIPWDVPLHARMNAHRERDQVVVDVLECKSDFLQVSGKGTVDDAQFTAVGDLSKLMVNLERIVDLGVEQMSGKLSVNGQLRRRDDDRVSLTSKLAVVDFVYLIAKNNAWREPRLDLSLDVSGRMNSTPKLTQIDAASLVLKGGGDELDLRVTSPIDLTQDSSAGSAKATLKGSLASWQNRMRPLVNTSEWQLKGDVDLATTIAIDTQQINVNQLTVNVRQLDADGPEWLIQDPLVKLETAGQWNSQSKSWHSPHFTLSSDAVTVDIANLECVVGTQGLSSLGGTATYRGDLAKLSAWKNRALANPTHYLIGSLAGKANLSRQDRLTIGNVDATVEKFILAGQGTGPDGMPRWVALWKEPQVKLTGKGSYDDAADSIALEGTRFDVSGFSVAATGRMDQASSTQRIDLKGELNYDWDQLMTRLGPQAGSRVRMSGKDQRAFSLKGSLAAANTSTRSGVIPAAEVSFQPGVDRPPAVSQQPVGYGDLEGEAGIGWAAADFYGIKTGPCDVSVHVEKGICRFKPIELAVNEGKLHLTPTINLSREPMALSLPKEVVLQQIHLTPELCRESLKLVMPLLADSTQVEGRLSVEMQSAEIPLTAPDGGFAAGVLSIHGAQARPGPAAAEIVGAIEQIRSIITRRPPGGFNREQIWIEMTEQQVPVRFEKHRVFHEGMSFVVQNVPVRTRGSVGLDNSLELVVDIAIRDEWIGNNKPLAGLKGKSISVPVVGTISRPQIDPGFFANLARQVGGSALEGILQDKVGDELNGVINNGLEKLLRGKK